MSVSTTSDLALAEAEAGGVAVELVAGGDIAARSPWELFLRRFREDKFALVSIGFLIVLITVAILAPLVVKLFGAPGPYATDPQSLDIFGQPTGPSSAHLFGLDQIGRDVF